MPRLHFFNPGYEAAIYQRTLNYTPPANVRKMRLDLASLPLWYAQEEDFVFLHNECLSEVRHFLAGFPRMARLFPRLVTRDELTSKAVSLPPVEVTPWGLSPDCLHQFERLRARTGASLHVPEWKPDFEKLSGRRSAVECMRMLRDKMPDMSLPPLPGFCADMRQVTAYLQANEPPFVAKAPYSSSGRGLCWITGRTPDRKSLDWLKGTLAKQEFVCIERALEKTRDFALEFYSDGEGEIHDSGLSVFDTDSRGAYAGNRLDDSRVLASCIVRLIGEANYARVRQSVRDVLRELYGSRYKGYIGVDMLIYKQADGTHAIHPCVEINMRYTMGIVAHLLYQNWILPGRHGIFRVVYDGPEGKSLVNHRHMLDTYPPRFESGRFECGYISLCPVKSDTCYRAYCLIGEENSLVNTTS